MKKMLIATVALATFAATPSMAADFTVSGTVNAVCSYTGGSISFNTIATNADGSIAGSQSASSTGQAGFYCNGANTTATLSHAALSNGNASPPSGFTGTINFTPVVKVDGADLVTGDQSSVAFGAQAGSLVVEARTLTASGKVLAGSYNGSITLTLTPTA